MQGVTSSQILDKIIKDNQQQPAPPGTNDTNQPPVSNWQKLGNTGKAVANLFTSSEQTLGKGLSTVPAVDKAFSALTGNKPVDVQGQLSQESAAKETQIQALTDALHKQTDPDKRAHLLQGLKNLGVTADITAGDINPGFNLTSGQVVGAAGGFTLQRNAFNRVPNLRKQSLIAAQLAANSLT